MFAGTTVRNIHEDNVDEVKEKLEAQERIRKAKANTEIDEATRRRSSRNIFS
jgi:hypothetical protein